MSLEQLGPYRIGRRLGRGGMGTVYEATNATSGESAAIKVLHPTLADEEGFRERFEIEIETLKKLRHPHIVRLHGFGAQGETLYYAMEYVRGTNLEDELQNGRRFTWREVTQAGIKLARALKLAHDHGIVHRDLKPANVLLSTEEDIKLTDFGIAKLFGTYRLTSDGGLIGTAEYMSPEQAEGKNVTAASDLYSLGGVLFAMLSGRPPFRAKSLPEVLQLQRFAEPPRVTQFAPDTPSALADILTRLLSKTASERAANAGMLAKELSAMEHGLSAKTHRDDPHTISQTALDALSLSQSETLAGEVLPEDSQAGTLDPNQATRVAEGASTRSSAVGNSSLLGAAESDVPTMQAGLTAGAVPAAPAPLRLLRENRFLTVEEAEAETTQLTSHAYRRRLLWQVSGTVAVLLLLALTVFVALRPASADLLYERLVNGRAQGESLLEQEMTLQQFLDHYPADTRAAEVRRWQAELATVRLERTLNLRSEALLQDEATSPLVREYLLTKNLIKSDPPLALERWQAMLQVYGTSAPGNVLSDDEQRCLELTLQQIDHWKVPVQRFRTEQLQLLQQRLAEAVQQQPLNPARAKELLQGIVTLYADRAWAAEPTSAARRLLQEWNSTEK